MGRKKDSQKGSEKEWSGRKEENQEYFVMEVKNNLPFKENGQ